MRISKRSVAQRNNRARLVEGLDCFLCRTLIDVVRDGDTYYLVINNLGERCLRRTFVSLVECIVPFVRSRGQ